MEEKTLTIYEFIEAHCPYCRYVYYSVLRDLQVRRIELNRKLIKQGNLPMPILEIELVDVHGNMGCEEMQWFQNYSEKMGGMFTPAVRIGKFGKVYYLWGKEKKDIFEEKELTNTEKLKAQLINEIQDILSRIDRNPLLYDKDYYNNTRQMFIPVPHVMNTPYGVRWD